MTALHRYHRGRKPRIHTVVSAATKATIADLSTTKGISMSKMIAALVERGLEAMTGKAV